MRHKKLCINSKYFHCIADIDSKSTPKRIGFHLILKRSGPRESNKLVEEQFKLELYRPTGFVEKEHLRQALRLGKPEAEGDTKQKSRRKSGGNARACMTSSALKSTISN